MNSYIVPLGCGFRNCPSTEFDVYVTSDTDELVIVCKKCRNIKNKETTKYKMRLYEALNVTEIKCNVKNVDTDLAIECAEEFIDEGAEIETFVAWMIDQGYDMEVFEQ